MKFLNENILTSGSSLQLKNTTASSATQGGKLILVSDDGAAMGSGHRLGVIEFSGAEDASNNRSIGARIEALTESIWDGAVNNNASLLFYTTSRAAESEVLKLDPNKLATFAGAVTVTGTLTGTLATASQNAITTLAGVTNIGATGVNTLISSNDVQMYNPVNNGNPQLGIGSSATNQVVIWPAYVTDTQTLGGVRFSTYTTSGTANHGYFDFRVDEIEILLIVDGGIDFKANMGISIAGTDILTDSSGTATLSNIDALDATTRATTASSGRRYGNTIKILPGDWMKNDDSSGNALNYKDAATAGVQIDNSALEAIAFVAIPEGMKATHVNMYGTAASAVVVHEESINSNVAWSGGSAATDLAGGSGAMNTEIDLSADVDSTATNMLAIKVTLTAASQRIWGGTVTIAAI